MADVDTTVDGLIGLAARAIDVAPSDPEEATALVARIGDRVATNQEASAMVKRALGLVALGKGDTASGIRHLRSAVRQAEGAGLARRAGEARMSLAFALFMAGDTTAALHETDQAAPALTGVPAARLQMQRASILARVAGPTRRWRGTPRPSRSSAGRGTGCGRASSARTAAGCTPGAASGGPPPWTWSGRSGWRSSWGTRRPPRRRCTTSGSWPPCAGTCPWR